MQRQKLTRILLIRLLEQIKSYNKQENIKQNWMYVQKLRTIDSNESPHSTGNVNFGQQRGNFPQKKNCQLKALRRGREEEYLHLDLPLQAGIRLDNSRGQSQSIPKHQIEQL